jgi:hypothetical protein
VLVYHDLLGLTEGRAPRFVKRYANLADEIRRALMTYAAEVQNGVYPAEEHTYPMPEDELELFSRSVLTDAQAIDRRSQTDARAKLARPDTGTAGGASAEGVEHAHRDR